MNKSIVLTGLCTLALGIGAGYWLAMSKMEMPSKIETEKNLKKKKKSNCRLSLQNNLPSTLNFYIL